MRIKRIRIQNLTKHTDTDLHLPETGLVVVTGANGSGKSTLVEAVAVCRWGKSIRGSDLWAGPGEVVLETHDGDTYTRKRTKSGRTTLKSDHAPAYQTASRAQREIGGDPKLWQRSCVYAFDEVQSFIRATDADRKRMLEQVLGLDRFDTALKACRSDLATAKADHQTALHAVQLAEQKYASAHRLVDSLVTSYRDAPPPADQTVDTGAISAELAAARERKQDAAQAVADLRDESATVRAAIVTLDRQIASEGNSECPTCERPFEAYRGDVVAVLQAERTKLLRTKADIVAKGKAAVENERATDTEVRRLERQLAVAETRQADAKRQAEARAKLAQRLTDAEAELEASSHNVEGAKVDADRAAVDLANLQAAEKVLGTRGLRSHVLREALVGIEHAANYWLERFAPGVQVAIRPQRELKSGGLSDEIDVQFSGVAGGNGYNGSSRGERRRQDVAITWALGEVEAAATGQQEATVFCDEPFDGLDALGVDSLVSAMEEVRTRRCVVVISHSDALVRALRPDAHYHVENGTLTRRR